ncbi:hypothetical protein STEG23_016180 [Scotinomys teguina]
MLSGEKLAKKNIDSRDPPKTRTQKQLSKKSFAHSHSSLEWRSGPDTERGSRGGAGWEAPPRRSRPRTRKAERAAQARWVQNPGSKPSHVLLAAHSPEARKGNAPAPVPGRTGEINTQSPPSISRSTTHFRPATFYFRLRQSRSRRGSKDFSQRFPLTFSSVKCKEVT